MEYEFRRDLLGNAEARFSMGHEAIGSWLIAEIVSRPTTMNKTLTSLYQVIAELQAKERWEYTQEGEEFDLKLNRNEAIIRSNTLPDEDNEDDLTDDMAFYDQELIAECGLDDFKVMLESWQQFNER